MQLDRLDYAALGTIGLVIAAIVFVVLLGNNVGVQVESYAPRTAVAGSSTISIRFYDEMKRDSVEKNFSIEPEVSGKFRWSSTREVIFEPDQPLAGGTTYRVRLKQGAESNNGNAELKDDLEFSFRVNLPKVLYLSPSTSPQRNLMSYDLNTGEVQQLTDTEFGVADYAISPDGKLIAYSIYNQDGSADIWLYDVKTGSTRQLTNCANAFCAAPSWHPDGTRIAYEREDYNSSLGVVGARRIWVVDINSVQSTTLFQDSQIVGHSPTFSPSGNRIALFSTNPPGIMVYDFVSGESAIIDSMQGIVGSFSADGTKLIYPILVRGAMGDTFYTQLEGLEVSGALSEGRRYRITGDPSAPIEDIQGFWNPDGVHIALARRYLDDRYTFGAQIYLLNTETNEVEPLVYEESYTHGGLEWSPDGNLLVYQRFNHEVSGSKPEIWYYNMTTKESVKVTDDAFLPGFLP